MHRSAVRSSIHRSPSNRRRAGWILAALCAVSACGGEAEPDPVGNAEPLPALESVEVAGIHLEPRSMVEGRVSLLMPAGLELMDEEALAFKYPSDRRPTQVYTDESGMLNLIVNHTAESMAAEGLDQARQFTEEMFGKMDPTAEWVASEMRTVQGREWFYLDFRSTASGLPIRNMMAATSLGGTMLMVSANMTDALEADWVAPVEAVLASVQVRGE